METVVPAFVEANAAGRQRYVQFLKELAALFESTKTKGSIWITHKRLTYDKDDSPMKVAEGVEDPREYPCLLRVSEGKKSKFSTTVTQSQLPAFHQAYGTLLKASFTTLRKRDRKREKLRAEQVAKRKKKLSEAVVVDKPKRGKGRRQRQRQVKAAQKQEEAIKRVKEREEERAKAKAAAEAQGA